MSIRQLTQRSEEPSVLSTGVALLQGLLDSLLGLLTLRHLLEGLVGNDALEALQLESVAGGHQVVVVDGLDEGLELAALLRLLLTHAARHFEGVALDTGDEGVGEWVSLGALVVGLDDHDLESREKKSVSAFLLCIFFFFVRSRDDDNCFPPLVL